MSNTKHSYQDSDSDPSGNPNAKDSIFAEDGTTPHPTSEESPEQLVDALEHQLADLRGRELKAQAELENFRRRTLRDVETQLKFASISLVSDLLEVVDNLHRATESAAASSTQNTDGLIAGVRMVQQQFANVLAKHHCKPIPGVGHPFDPNVHQAIAQQPSNDFPAGTVLIETSRGYLMHDRVVRPSMVIVSTGPAQTE
ncbi:MAG: nucleotide exchange factor GrpE [Planctomycetota bacterium]|jgi:molecular chaperone GrpE